MKVKGMKSWYLIIDVEKCENCQNCFLACKDEHVGNDWPGYAAPQPNQGPGWISIYGKERGRFPFIDVGYLPSPCMHCDNAPCIKAAGDGAIYKRPDGIVIIDPLKAKGRENLVSACPYGAILGNDEHKLPQKCTLCAHLLDDGWTQTRCTQACPTGALSLRQAEEEEMKRARETEKLEVYEPERKTNPRVYYKNLYRFTRCFIGGSVAVREEGKEECAAGAKVSLSDSGGKSISECLADSFGDFKFDGLPEAGGSYAIRISFKDYPEKTVELDLKTSHYAGVIFL
jgi:Fe-S-cluster-containing dehydrogenase component